MGLQWCTGRPQHSSRLKLVGKHQSEASVITSLSASTSTMFARPRPSLSLFTRISRVANPLRQPAFRSLTTYNSPDSGSSQIGLDHVDFTAEGPKPYTQLEKTQDGLRGQFLDWKSSGGKLGEAPPLPKLLTFESTPTITLGRRQEPPSGKAELARLLQPVNVSLTRDGRSYQQEFQVQCVKSGRGGLTTYHGPGQLVCWPVIDMISPLYPRYTVSSYATHLEAVTQRMLYERYGIETFTSAEDPGVWVERSDGQSLKIAALGVHHRRHVTSYGIAINIDIAVAGGEKDNVWSRFTPCGLEGKGVTSVEDQIGSERLGQVDMSAIAAYWAATFQQGLSDASKRIWGAHPRKAVGNSVEGPVTGAAALAMHDHLTGSSGQKEEEPFHVDVSDGFGGDDLF